jgi:hypothetical protein
MPTPAPSPGQGSLLFNIPYGENVNADFYGTSRIGNVLNHISHPMDSLKGKRNIFPRSLLFRGSQPSVRDYHSPEAPINNPLDTGLGNNNFKNTPISTGSRATIQKTSELIINPQEQAYIEGFVKRANEYGFNDEQAIELLKQANRVTEALSRGELSPESIARLFNPTDEQTLANIASGKAGRDLAINIPGKGLENVRREAFQNLNPALQSQVIDSEQLLRKIRDRANPVQRHGGLMIREMLESNPNLPNVDPFEDMYAHSQRLQKAKEQLKKLPLKDRLKFKAKATFKHRMLPALEGAVEQTKNQTGRILGGLAKKLKTRRFLK